MAIYYYDNYSKIHKTRNFGDDINPLLLGNLFKKDLVESDEICIMGIGTIISDEHLCAVEKYPRKIVFSSGVGYGTLTYEFDSSWNFSCVRGPKSAERLGISTDLGICDGAILLSDIFPPKKYNEDGEVLFIPHVESHWKSGVGLQLACENLGIRYLVPDIDATEFIDTVQRASLVITEAMHGAILSDAMRVPWVPVAFHFHNQFKWQDWFASIELDYSNLKLKPVFWNPKPGFKNTLKVPYQAIKYKIFELHLSRVIHSEQHFLSKEVTYKSLKKRLMCKVDEINSLF